MANTATSAKVSDAINATRELAHVARELPTREAQQEAFNALRVFIRLADVDTATRQRMTLQAEAVYFG